MALNFNGTSIKKMNFNGNVVKKAFFNGVQVFAADKEVYKDGVVGEDVTLTTFVNHTSGADVYTANNVLRFSHSQTSFTSGSKTGRITFDFTDFSSITIKGNTKGWARQADTTVNIGIDSASDRVSSTFDNTSFEKTFDVSALTGSHAIVGNVYINNTSGDTSTTAYNYLAISEIIAYA